MPGAEVKYPVNDVVGSVETTAACKLVVRILYACWPLEVPRLSEMNCTVYAILMLLVCSDLDSKASDVAGTSATELMVTADKGKRYSSDPLAMEFTTACLKAIVLFGFEVKFDALIPETTYLFHNIRGRRNN